MGSPQGTQFVGLSTSAIIVIVCRVFLLVLGNVSLVGSGNISPIDQSWELQEPDQRKQKRKMRLSFAARYCKYKHKRRSQGSATFRCSVASFDLLPAFCIEVRKISSFRRFAHATCFWSAGTNKRAGGKGKPGAYLPRGNNLTHGPLRRGPRAHVHDRTADTIAAALPAVETSPTGVESAGRPSRTAAVAPPPTFVRRLVVKFMLPVLVFILGDFPQILKFPAIKSGYFFLTVEAASELSAQPTDFSTVTFGFVLCAISSFEIAPT